MSTEKALQTPTRTPRTPFGTKERKSEYELKFPMDWNEFEIFKRYLLESKLPSYLQTQSIIIEALSLFEKEKSLVEIELPKNGMVVIVGDLHGQIFDFKTVIDINGEPSKDKIFIFNGDFVDRGPHGIEIVLLIYSLKLIYPNYVFLNKGNHEVSEMNAKYGFKTECIQKYGNATYDLIQQTFEVLPYAILIDKKYIVIHGGLTEYIDLSLEDIASIEKPFKLIKDQRKKKIAKQLLWSDPIEDNSEISRSIRGTGIHWGSKLTDTFLKNNNLELIIRSHQKMDNGYGFNHNNKVLTVFSASYYCGTNNNKGATISLIDNNGKLEIKPNVYVGSLDVNIEEKCITETLKQIKNRIFQNRNELLQNFFIEDETENGSVTLDQWSYIMEKTLKLNIPWKSLQPYLCSKNKDGKIVYTEFYHRYSLHVDPKLLKKFKRRVIENICEKIYNNMNTLKKLFSQIDKDNDGIISYHSFLELLKEMETGMSQDQMMEFIDSIDDEKSGFITYHNFEKTFIREFQRTQLRKKNEKHIKYINKQILTKYQDISSAFKLWDKNRDGKISYVEFYNSIHNLDSDNILNDSTIRELFQLVDRKSEFKLITLAEFEYVFASKDGTYAEDIIQNMFAIIHKNKMVLYDVFQSFDLDGNGKITIEELISGISAFNISVDSPLSEKLIHELHLMIEKDDEGMIDYKKFLAKFKVVDKGSQ